MPVPFVDLKAEYDICRERCDFLMRKVLESAGYIGGEMVAKFESEMAEHQEAKFVKACANGTEALWITLRSLGVGPGDEVITTPCTAIPTPEAITLCGAKVVFADIKPGTFHLDPASIEKSITERTKAILPVHLYGIPCDMEGIMKVAEKHNLFVVEDCAQAQGAKLGGKRVGNFGHAACFSFFPSKNLGAFGDGGAMSTDNEELAAKFNRFANHGRASKLEHIEEGTNSRLDALQAAVLRAKLPLLDERNALRREAAGWYAAELSGTKEVTLPRIPENSESVFHIFPVIVPCRDTLRAYLKENGISTGIHYAMSLNLQPAYEYLGCGAGTFENAESAFAGELSLPMFPEINREQVKEVSTLIRNFYNS